MKEKRNLLKKKKGITLIALVVTLVVLLIVAAITINMVFNDNGLFRSVKKQADNINETVHNDKEKMNQLLGEIIESAEGATKNYPVKIYAKVASYNETLGEFPIVYKVTGEKDGKVVYSNIVSTTITKPGTQEIDCRVKLPQDAKIVVEELYSGVNYELTTNNQEEAMPTDATTPTEFSFNHQYVKTLNYNASLSIK